MTAATEVWFIAAEIDSEAGIIGVASTALAGSGEEAVASSPSTEGAVDSAFAVGFEFSIAAVLFCFSAAMSGCGSGAMGGVGFSRVERNTSGRVVSGIDASSGSCCFPGNSTTAVGSI